MFVCELLEKFKYTTGKPMFSIKKFLRCFTEIFSEYQIPNRKKEKVSAEN